MVQAPPVLVGTEGGLNAGCTHVSCELRAIPLEGRLVGAKWQPPGALLGRPHSDAHVMALPIISIVQGSGRLRAPLSQSPLISWCI